MKAIAYYRSRPSEPEASAEAMRLQREAVRLDVASDGYEVVGEFIEREGEGGQAGAVYVDAVRAAKALTGADGVIDVALLIASTAGIGTGERFDPSGLGGNGILYCYLEARSTQVAATIPLPSGPPGLICLYGQCIGQEVHTDIYLCNASENALSDVEAEIKMTNMAAWFSTPAADPDPPPDWEFTWRCAVIAPGTCALIHSAVHHLWDNIYSYRISFTDAAGVRHVMKANHKTMIEGWVE